MEIYWPMKISNKEIRKRATSAPSVSKSSGDVGSSLVTFSEWIQIALEGRRSRGRPKENWRRTTEKERTALGFDSWIETTVAARDRVAWQRRVSYTHLGSWSKSKIKSFTAYLASEIK